MEPLSSLPRGWTPAPGRAFPTGFRMGWISIDMPLADQIPLCPAQLGSYEEGDEKCNRGRMEAHPYRTAKVGVSIPLGGAAHTAPARLFTVRGPDFRARIRYWPGVLPAAA